MRIDPRKCIIIVVCTSIVTCTVCVNTATATLMNTLSTAGYGATELCAQRRTFLKCRTVNDAMEAADLVIDSACGGR